jgi:hypothetical protein
VGQNLAIGPAGLLPPPPPHVAQAAQQAGNVAQPAYRVRPASQRTPDPVRTDPTCYDLNQTRI